MSSHKKHVRHAAAAAIRYPFGLKTAIMELFGIGPGVAISVLTVTLGIVIASIVYFIESAPPSTITMSSGPEGSMFFKNAQKYANILARNGVKVKVVTSLGSIENQDRLNDPKSHVDVAFVQTGPANVASDKLVSLGSVSYQPLMIFYRGKEPKLISDLAGKRIAIGPVGSGTRNVALALLNINGIEEGGSTTLLDDDALQASEGLKAKTLDAAFVMSESASAGVIKGLLHEDDIHLYGFKQANAYSRKFEYLSVLDMPQGGIDLKSNIPSTDMTLMGTMVELLATKHLNSALVDLLVEAATEIHAHPGMYQRRGEFPMAVEHAVPLSDEATVYYKSGKGFFYRHLNFWLASMVGRLLFLLPGLVVLISVLRTVPAFFRWTTQLQIRKRYREIRMLEQRFLNEEEASRRESLKKELDRIAGAVNRMKVRASFADQFYGLRGHIDYVRRVMETPLA